MNKLFNNSSNIIKECKSVDLENDKTDTSFYVQYIVWPPIIFIGIICYLIIILSFTNKQIIYTTPHFSILTNSFLISGLLYLIFIIPLVFGKKLWSEPAFIIYAISSTIVSEVFRYLHVLVMSFFGFKSIITFLHFDFAKIIVYKKHSINLISGLLLISSLVVSCKIFNARYKLHCVYKSKYYGYLEHFHQHVLNFALDIIFYCTFPLFMVILHIISFIRIMIMSDQRTKISMGLKDLPSKNVFIYDVKERNYTAFIIYGLFLLSITPRIVLLTIYFDSTYDVTGFLYNFKLLEYFVIIFTVLAVIPYFVYIPVILSLKNVVQNFKTWIQTKEQPVEEFIRQDTLNSIGSIERSNDRVIEEVTEEETQDSPSTELKFKIRSPSASPPGAI